MSYKDKKKSVLYDSSEGYDLFAPDYDIGEKFLDSIDNNAVFGLLKGLKGKRILDVGAGTGRIIPKLKKFGIENIVAADVSGGMLKVLKKKFPNIPTVEADIEKLPFEDESFDAVISLFVIVHLKILEKAFEEVYRVLKPGGVFILSNINQRKPPKLLTKKREEIVIKSFYHIPEHVISALEGAFFKIEKNEFVYEKEVRINQIIMAVKI